MRLLSTKILTCAVIIGVFFSFTRQSARSQTAAVSDSPQLEALRKRGYVRLGLSNEPPWTVIDAEGRTGGAGPDLTRAVFQRMGVRELAGVLSTFGALIPGLLARRSDAISSGLFIRPGRCQAVAFSEPDLCDREALLMKMGDHPTLRTYRDVAADASVRIGVPAGGTEQREAQAAGVPADRLLPVPDGPSGMIMLRAGRIQVYSLPASSAQHLADLWQGQKFSLVLVGGTPVMCAGTAFRPDATALRNAYDRVLATLKSDGTYDRILRAHGFDPGLARGHTRRELCGEEAPL
ncbi:ectoine/hydroxyectoine ABC transporter substrate-binding protein EhuB [Acetobacter fallax]|nr:ectoine/hydroxyectoine ABC transporter substrate-binding protein EhuB [Acetobacter fallax]